MSCVSVIHPIDIQHVQYCCRIHILGRGALRVQTTRRIILPQEYNQVKEVGSLIAKRTKVRVTGLAKINLAAWADRHQSDRDPTLNGPDLTCRPQWDPWDKIVWHNFVETPMMPSKIPKIHNTPKIHQGTQDTETFF